MAENSENIEARLCSYVEGELDEQGRIEIEQHLLAHPNHRRLLAELQATRELLRFLPREQAPPELAEMFTAQLERSALLDSPGGESGGGIGGGDPLLLRPNFVPRLMALAAVLILAIGLGVLVYFALPRGESGAELAMPVARPSASQPTTLESGPAFDADRFGGSPRREMARKDASPKGGAEFAKGGGGGKVTAAESTLTLDKSPVGNSNTLVTNATAAPVYLIVSVDNPQIALQTLTENLSQNAISWEEADPTPPAPSEQLHINSAPALQQAKAPQQQLAPEPPQAAAQQPQAARPQQQAQRGYMYNAHVELQNARSLEQQQILRSAGQQQQLQQRPNAAAVVARAGTESKELSKSAAPSQDASPADVAAAGEPPAIAAARDDSKAQTDGQTATNTLPPSPVRDALSTSQPARGATAGAAQRQQQEGQYTRQRQGTTGELTQQFSVADADVSGIVAHRLNREQIVRLSQELNRGAQQIELIAEDEQLQAVAVELNRSSVLPDATAATPEAPTEEPTEHTKADAVAAAEPAPAATPAPAVVVPPAAAAPETSAAAKPAGPGPVAMKQGKGGPTTRPSAPKYSSRQGAGRPESVMRPGMKLKVTVDELAGPDTDKTNATEVAADGTIRLPQVDPIKVDGLTRAQTEEAIARSYRDAKVIDTPTVSVERDYTSLKNSKVGSPSQVAAAAANQSAEVGADAEKRAAKSNANAPAKLEDKNQRELAIANAGSEKVAEEREEPTTRRAVQSQAVSKSTTTTRPATTGPTTVPGASVLEELDGEHLDVVILIQRSPLAVPDAAPPNAAAAESAETEAKPAEPAPAPVENAK